MNERANGLRVETLALDAIIRDTLAAAETSVNTGARDRMVFLGNHHQSFPTAMVRDPVLEPVDKLIWMVIMVSVHDTGGHTAFPGYEAIGRMANVASRSTIARAIAILRATRWLTLCAGRRRVNGRFGGHVYALHDEPIPLADSLHLDANYLSFLHKARAHRHPRVAAVANAVLDSIDEDIKAGTDLNVQPHPIERRLRSAMSRDGTLSGRFFSLTRDSVQRLRNDLQQSNHCKRHHDQNLHTVDPHDQISNLSSSSINNNKTTTTNIDVSNIDARDQNDAPLIFPARLSETHRQTALRYLSTLTPAQRQPVLDELEGRFIAETKGMQPVYDEINFLQSLCTQMRRGKFKPNLGVRVRERREAQRRQAPVGSRRDAGPPIKESDPARERRIAESRARLSDVRKLLIKSSPIEHQTLTNES